MSALASDHAFGGNPLVWNLFFARHPEPDLEFTEEELEETTAYRSSPSPTQSPKPSGGGKRPLLLVLLLVLIGGGAYVAMDPGMFMEYLGPILGESPAPEAPPPPVAMKPAIPKPTPQAPVAQSPVPEATQAPMAPPAAEPSSSAIPVPSTVPAASALPTPAAESTPPMPAPQTPPTPTVSASPTPLFSEGQRVIVLPNQTAPGTAVPLMHDAAGTKPNLAVPAGTILTVLDGDLQDSGWVYSVRSAFGDKGWIVERQLKLKP